MKKLTVIAGSTLVGVLGMASANAQSVYGLAPNLTQQELSKTWSVQASLRGFYDDNYTTAPDASKLESFGFEITPSVSLNLPREQTYIGFTASYTGRWFEDRVNNEIDHIFQINGILNHAFNPQNRLELRDSFVVAQEGELITPGTATTIARSEGNNIRNIANLTYTTQLTETLGLVLGYQNSFYDYEQDGAGSFSAALDRLEHLFSINGRLQVAPPTTVLAGYQYGLSDFTSSDSLTTSPPVVAADTRNSRSHFIYGGVEHSFTPQLAASLRGGIQLIDFPNDPNNSDGSSPYVDGSVSWTYNPGSYLMAGVRHQRNVTDVTSVVGGAPTTDSIATTLYGVINHQLTAKLTGSLIAQYQFSEFQNGGADSQNEEFFTVGLNLAYRINQFLSAEVGYNFDVLTSDLANREFDRNRLYMGLRALY